MNTATATAATTITPTTALQTPVSQQLLSLAAAALVTAGVLAGLLGLAGGDQAAQLAHQIQAAPQASFHAIASLLVQPLA